MTTEQTIPTTEETNPTTIETTRLEEVTGGCVACGQPGVNHEPSGKSGAASANNFFARR
jgi:hypothetical protein